MKNKKKSLLGFMGIGLILLAVGSFFLIGHGAFFSPSHKMTGQEISENLDTLLKNLTEKDRFSGVVLLARGDKILFKKAYGLANKRYNIPNRIDTKFNLGSMNKMFTAVAIAQLVEKGKLSYEDKIGKFLDSSWVHPQTAKKVKVKHLLTHTAGLGNYFFGKFWDSSRLLYRKLDDWKPIVREEIPMFEPGTNWSYSNTGMLLAGAIVAEVSGQSYYDYIRDNIYIPAKMINTDCYEMDRPVPNLAMGYIKEYDKNGPYWRNNIYDHVLKGGPAGGGFSTVEDLFRFARALMNNKLTSKKSVALLTSPKAGLSSGYGYGFEIRYAGKEKIVGHGGGFPGINSMLQIFERSGFTYVILSNYSNIIKPIRSKLNQLVLNQL